MQGVIVGMAGSGGDGIVSAGEILLHAFAQAGYGGMLGKSFGSQIRGGESSCRLRIAAEPVWNAGGVLDLALALNLEDFIRFESELPVNARTVVVYDRQSGVSPPDLPLAEANPELALALPLAEMARSAGRPEARNLVAVGLVAEWLGLPRAAAEEAVGWRFARRDQATRELNRRALGAGFDYGRIHPPPRELGLDPPSYSGPPRAVADGNEMCARGALFAGCKFFAGYPITPASEIMQRLQAEIWKHGGAFLQAEDEIAGIGAALGASFAGAKAMTATSGPGLSLQAEMLGLASAAELPLVCVDVQRGGPSTGLPTKQEQADLFAAAFSAHGDSVRPVLAPTGAADAFFQTVEAFNIAETYQTPVILLSDQEIAQSKAVIDPIEIGRLAVAERLEPTAEELKAYRRFRHTGAGVSPLSRPGTKGGNYLAAGLEHDERGAPSASGAVHSRMNEKRLGKLEPLKVRRDLFLNEGNPLSAIGLIAWGNIAGVVREAAQRAWAEGIEVKLLVPKLLYPVADEIYRDFFRSLRRCVVVEQSQQGQLHRIIRMWTEVPREFVSVSKSGANPITPDEILRLIQAMAQPASDRFQTHYCDLLTIL